MRLTNTLAIHKGFMRRLKHYHPHSHTPKQRYKRCRSLSRQSCKRHMSAAGHPHNQTHVNFMIRNPIFVRYTDHPHSLRLYGVRIASTIHMMRDTDMTGVIVQVEYFVLNQKTFAVEQKGEPMRAIDADALKAEQIRKE